MHKFFLGIFTFQLFILSVALGQEGKIKPVRGKLYFSWGYNKDWYSLSDIHFVSKNSDEFDFIVYNARAHDRPQFDEVFQSGISIPQFIYRIGYSFAQHPDQGIELGFDHAKYVMMRNDVLHVKGKIHENYIDKDT